MGIERKASPKRLSRLFVAVFSSFALILSSCVSSPEDAQPNINLEARQIEAEDTQEPETNEHSERCREIVKVGAYAFGVGTVYSAEAFGGEGRVRWLVDENRYKKDSDLDTAGEGVICFRAGLIRQIENGRQESVKKVRLAFEETQAGLGSLAYISLEDLLPLADFLFTVQGGQEVDFDTSKLLAQMQPAPIEVDSSTLKFSEGGELPLAGDSCLKIGLEEKSTEGAVVCRRHSDGKGYWVSLTGATDFPGQINGNFLPVEMCKIQDARPRFERGGGSTSFPRSEERIPANGTVNVAIIPIDYPDAKAKSSPTSWILESLEKVDSWVDFFTDGNLRYNWIIHDEWITMPKEAAWYVWDHATIVDGKYVKGDRQLQSDYDQAYDVFSAAEEHFDLENIDFAWVFSNPEADEVDWAPGYMLNENVPTRSGVYDISYYSIGTFLYWGSRRGDAHNRPLWITMLHEMGHAHGIAGHAPGNGWTYDVMASGSTLSAWNGWLVEWIPDSEYVCIDGEAPGRHRIVLDSVDLNRGGTIAAVVRVSDTKVLVVESRRKGPFSIDFPDGFAAITATLVDSEMVYQRYDGNYGKEKLYFSYFIRAEGAERKTGDLRELGLGDQNLLGYIGDTLGYEKIRISLTESSEYDTIEVVVLP